MGWAETSCMGWVGHWVEMGFKASGPGRVGFTANAGWGGSDWVTVGTSGRCCPLPAPAERERQRRRPAAAAAVPAGPPPTTSVDPGAPPSPTSYPPHHPLPCRSTARPARISPRRHPGRRESLPAGTRAGVARVPPHHLFWRRVPCILFRN